MASSHIAAVRNFNRFYTKQIGVLHEHLLASPYSLTEVRVLYEIAHRDKPSATDLVKELGLDPGYLSRILANFEKGGLLERVQSGTDRRQTHLSLTAKGQVEFAALDASSDQEVGALLATLSATEQARFLQAIDAIRHLLTPHKESPYTLRQHRPGDMGWVVHRHGVLYAQEYGWDERFEALVASIVAEFINRFDAMRERCWIAEKDGEVVGSVFLVKHSDEFAKLRLLLVEPSARGQGLGKRLVDECIAFARQAGYRRITLWTQQNLHAAQRIYANAGFQLVNEEPHCSFGHNLVAQTWDLAL